MEGRLGFRFLTLSAIYLLLLVIAGHVARGQEEPVEQPSSTTDHASATGSNMTDAQDDVNTTTRQYDATGAENVTSSDIETEASNTAAEAEVTSPGDVNTTSAAEGESTQGTTEDTNTTSTAAPESAFEDLTTEMENTTSGNETTEPPAPETTVPDVNTTSSENATEPANTTETTPGSDGGDSLPEIFTPSYETIHEKADYVIRDEDDNPCLLASLNVTIRVTYQVQEGPLKETYETTSAEIPRDAALAGTCGATESLLSLSWGNYTFTLNITFVLAESQYRPENGEQYNNTWHVSQVSLSYDTSDTNIFPGASEPKIETLTVKDLHLFRAPLGRAYLCQTTDALEMESKSLHLEFNYVHFQPFGVTLDQRTRFTNDTVECTGDLGTVPDQENAYTVPLIVACCLAAAVVIIIIAYASHRYVTRRLRQAEYKQME